MLSLLLILLILLFSLGKKDTFGSGHPTDRIFIETNADSKCCIAKFPPTTNLKPWFKNPAQTHPLAPQRLNYQNTLSKPRAGELRHVSGRQPMTGDSARGERAPSRCQNESPLTEASENTLIEASILFFLCD